jgi:hypothetical protein
LNGQSQGGGDELNETLADGTKARQTGMCACWTTGVQDSACEFLQDVGHMDLTGAMKVMGTESLSMTFRHDLSRDARECPTGFSASNINTEG